jgi:uncharacterized protein YgiM (DUF1202 family)
MPALIRMRGAVALLLASLLLLAGSPPVFADTDLVSGDKAVVANTGGDVILLRADAGYQFTVLSHLKAGTGVTVLDGPVEGDDGNLWYRVDAGGTTGYVFATFLVHADRAPAVLASEPAASRSQPAEAKAVVGTGQPPVLLTTTCSPMVSASACRLVAGAELPLVAAPR